MTAPSRICLCGFMGAGKSSVGRALASRLDYTFSDLDAEVEAEFGLAIHEIFRQAGEVKFRASETAHARRLLTDTNLVLALGGGALTGEKLTEAVRETSYLIYLQASPETLYDRIRDEDHRPLLEEVDEYADFLKVYTDRMATRQKGYESGPLTVSTDHLSVDEIVSKIMSTIDHE